MIDKLHQFFDLVGLLTTVFAVLMFFTGIVCWALGIFPLFYRFGLARWSRKITVVSQDGMFNSLQTDLIDTGIFRKSNIARVKSDSLAKVKEASLVLIHYQSLNEDEIKRILADKRPGAGFIFYFPEFSPGGPSIPPHIITLINNQQFTTVVNMRGRLMNDIVTTLLSTSYEKR